jgi:cytochrome P450
MLWRKGELVGYAGWSMVDRQQAERWYRQGGEFPTIVMQGGSAVIATIIVCSDPALIYLLNKGVSHQCAGLPVYRLRSFQDGREEMRRPPILGRKQHIFSFQRAYAQLSGLLNDLYLRAAGQPGKLNFPVPIVTDPNTIQTVLRQPERFIKNYAFLQRLADGRFTSNGEEWQMRSRLTQTFYNNAIQQVPFKRLREIYAGHLTQSENSVFDDALQSAVQAVSKAFGLSKPIYWPLQQVENLRNELMLLQALDFFGGTQDELDTAQANLAKMRSAMVKQWQADAEMAAWLQTLTQEFDAPMELVQNMMAATETTAATVEWMARILAAQPALLAQLKTHGVTDGDGELTTLAQQFILEVLRLYPPVPFITRVCQSAKPQEDGFVAKQPVAISLVGLHTHPDYWQQPMRFWPQRPEWQPNEEGKINLQQPAYFPFLTGPRVCGGRKLAMLELHAALDVLVNDCKITPVQTMPQISYGMVSRPA